MMKIIKNAIYTTEKTIVVISLVLAIGLINNGNLSLEVYRKTLLFGASLGFVLGLSQFIFDLEKFNLKVSYIIHFILGFAALNVLEGVIFNGTFLPLSSPINYISKFVIFTTAYIAVTLANVFHEKRDAKVMLEKIKSIKENTN